MGKLLSWNDLGHVSAVNHIKSLRRCVQFIAVGFGLLTAQRLLAQAPPLLWRTNVGANFLAVDAQGNVYANAGSTIITLNSAGVPQATNAFNQTNTAVQRDAAGNYYFAGQRPGAVSGNGSDYGTTNAGFLTKYTAAGILVWSNGFGPTGFLKYFTITDLQVDTNGNVYVGYVYNTSIADFSAMVAKLDSTGSSLWNLAMPKAATGSTIGSTRVTVLSPTNGFALTYASRPPDPGPCAVVLSSFDSNGAATVVTNWSSDTSFSISTTPPLSRDSAGNFFTRETGIVAKRDPSGTLVWQIATPYDYPVGADPSGGVYISSGGPLSRYDTYGNLAWSTNFSNSWCTKVVVDNSGNRLLSFSDSTIAKIGNEPFVATITSPPQPQTAFVGSNATFSIGASGATPFRYFWFFNNSFLSVQSNSLLVLPSVTTNQAGSYYVIVSNIVNTVTSAPVQLRVKRVELFIGNQLLTNGTYSFPTNPTITVRSAFTNGSAFYTLDGSAPDFSSTFYSGPFALSSNATVRAIGYSADFSQSEEADQISAVVLEHYTLKAATPGGGSITLSPPGGDYTSGTTVTATAVPNAGWFFLYWAGDISGTNASLDIPMNADRSITAIFGTTLSTTVQGNGQVLLYPASGAYRYGQVVRVTGVPGAGSYFGFWGNAASGNINPLYFTVTNPSPTISSIFGTNSGSQVNVYLTISGRGDVTANPQSNVYTTGQSVSLTATPEAGGSFVNWSGDVSSTQNPLTVILNQSKTITANFTGGTILKVDPQLQEGLRLDGFHFSLLSDPGSVLEIRSSSNLVSWESMGFVTNQTGEMELLDPSAADSVRKFYKSVP
jgi:hypothetical protein